MNLVVKITATALLGAALGLGATWASVTRGFTFDAREAGPWRKQPHVASAHADPYARALVARTAQAPLGAAEGLAFTAMRDSAGGRLDANCDYRLSGNMPNARAWTVTLADPQGWPMQTGARTGFTSAELLRDARGAFTITLAREARPGNWLPLAPSSRFVLLLRLYDTPHAMSAASLTASDLPQIIAERCR